MPAIIILFLIFSLNCFALNDTYPIKWTSGLKLKSLQEINTLLASKDYVGVTASFINDNNKTATAEICNDYFKLINAKYYPIDNVNNTMEGFFIKACQPLTLLKKAKSARFSFVRNFNLQKDYGLLPGKIIFPDLSSNIQKEGSIKNLYPDTQLEKTQLKDKDAIVLSSKKGLGTTAVEILAWGDFNNDGFDDMLILVATYAYKYEGSYRAYNLSVLTRKAKDDPLSIVDVESI